MEMFKVTDFTSYSKRVYNLIAIDEEKEFLQPMGVLELNFVACRADMRGPFLIN